MTKTDQVLQSLRDMQEGPITMTTADGTWASVYLDNARPADMSRNSFRSHLAALSKRGLYYPQDGMDFGSVKLEEETR